MNIHLQKYPLLRLIPAMATGIVLSWFYGQELIRWALWFSPLVLLVVLFLHLRLANYAYRWITGLGLYIIFILVGFWAGILSQPLMQQYHYAHQSAGKALLVRIIEPLSERRNTYRTIAEIRGIIDSTEVHKAFGKMMVYFRKPSEAPLPEYGELLVISKFPTKIAPPLNPGQFDYQTHLARKGITHQVFLAGNDWMSTEQAEYHPVYRWAYAARDYFVKALSQNGLKGDEFAVASAILLGYNEFLSHELRYDYTAAGAMHVLCVSGLHVGIIYLVFNLLLRFLDRLRHGSKIRLILLLWIIWFYAFVTGLSPSVLRSTLMISFLMIGQLMRRRGYALNTLAAAAIFILLFEPYALFSIGFQLSFAAVAGIILFQKPINQIYVPKSRILAYFWEATSVALAAQLSTTPLVVYYFQQFPTYFWLSNLFLTPLSFLVISTGMMLLLLSPLPAIAPILGSVVSALIYTMNALISWIESLPLSILKNLYISAFESIGLLLMALLLALWIRKNWQPLLLPIFGLLVLVSLSATFRHLHNLKQDGFVVYALPNHTAMSFVHGTQHVLVADQGLLNEPSTMALHMTRFWNARGVANPVFVSIDNDFQNQFMVKQADNIVFGGQLIHLYDLENPTYISGADVSIIFGKPRQQAYRKSLPPAGKLVLLDASLRGAAKHRFSSMANDGLKIYDLGNNGAYIHGF